MNKCIDIEENIINELSSSLLGILLKDQTTGTNIIWATDDYRKLGYGYSKVDSIFPHMITGANSLIIRPRISKTKEQRDLRIRNKGEVFTPSWVCNLQNNLIDEQWFGHTPTFNTNLENSWITNKEKINFSNSKTWKDYVTDVRLEITCGEAPYLTSRYDTVNGNYIDVKDRIGLLDRKLRVINENVDKENEWINWSKKALESTYGFEFQGDNLLIARENVLFTTIEHFFEKFNKIPEIEILCEYATIISWNLWQMDGIKYVVPFSCHNEDIIELTLFGEKIIKRECVGCVKNLITKHNGIYCKIKDWNTNKTIKYVNISKKR